MLITALHLLVIVLLFTAGALCGVPATRGAGLGESGSVVVCLSGAILVLVMAGWPVFKLLSLRPLILPTCPSCGRRHVNFHIPREAWPDPVLVCAYCSKPLRLALSKEAGSKPWELPSVTLRWPGFLGVWKPAAIQKGPE